MSNTESLNENQTTDIERDLPKTVAVVDLGSNSFHLVLARIINNDVQILLREKIKVRMAKGLNDELMLDDAAIQRGLDTLAIYAHTLDGFHVDSVKILATYTLRSAINAHAFINQARDIIPYPIEIISGQEEARLIYQGVAHSMHFSKKRLVIDIGGGSTELIIGKGFETLALSSRNVGCVNLTRMYFPDGKISKKQIKKAQLHLEQELQPILKQYKGLGWAQCIGTSGTNSALLEIIEANGWGTNEITLASLEKIKQRMLAFDHFDALTIDGLSEERQPVILSGLLILLTIVKTFKIDTIEYCDKALREGALFEMEERLQHHDIRERSVSSLATRLIVDDEQNQRVQQVGLKLLEQVHDNWPFKTIKESRLFIKWAAILHEIGLHINSSGSHNHAAYIVANSPLLGFSQEEQLLLTTLLRFHRKKIKKDELPSFTLFKDKHVRRLIALFRLSVLFNQKRQDNFLPEWQCQVKDNEITLTFPNDWLEDKTLFEANLESEQLQLKKLDIDLTYKSH